MAGWIIKATLENTHPPVWRRIVIPQNAHFGDLHEVLQVAFGWCDYHMHEFESPGRDLVMGPDDEEWGFEDAEDETAYEVGDILQVYRWVRYTYDFGDDWQHKIVLEKEDPSYDKDYATILKAKGDGFEEDSGGVWAYEDMSEDIYDEDDYVPSRVPFDLESANARLEKGLKKMLKQSWMDDDDREDDEEQVDDEKWKNDNKEWLDDDADWLDDENREEELDADEDAEAAFDINKARYMEDMETLEELLASDDFPEKTTIITSGETDYPAENNNSDPNQQILPFLTREEVQRANRKKRLGKQTLELAISKDKMETFAGSLYKAVLEKFHKVLDLSAAKNAPSEELGASYVAFLKKNPRYIISWFTEEEWEVIETLLQEKVPTDDPDILGDVLKGLVHLGVAGLKVQRLRGYPYITIMISEEAVVLLRNLKPKETRKLLAERNRLEGFIRSHLDVYGLVEMDELFSMYVSGKKRKGEGEELQKWFAWQTLRSRGWTGITDRKSNARYLCMPWLEEGRCLHMRKMLPNDFRYKSFSEEDLAYDTHFFLAKNTAWGTICSALSEMVVDDDLCEQIASSVCYRLYQGETADVLKKQVTELIKAETAEERFALWDCVVNLWMNAPQTALKGYSRAEYRKMTGSYPAWLPFSQEPLKTRGGSKTHLIEMPFWVQDTLYRALRETNETPTDQEVDTILNTFPKNKEVLIWKGEWLLKKKEYEKAEELYLQLAENGSFPKEEMDSLVALAKMQALVVRLNAASHVDMARAEEAYLGSHPFTDAEKNFVLSNLSEEMRVLFEVAMDQYTETASPIISLVPRKREGKKVGRNDPCPCGSGKKYKNCCGR